MVERGRKDVGRSYTNSIPLDTRDLSILGFSKLWKLVSHNTERRLFSGWQKQWLKSPEGCRVCGEPGRQTARWTGDKAEMSEAIQPGLVACSTCDGKLPGFGKWESHYLLCIFKSDLRVVWRRQEASMELRYEAFVWVYLINGLECSQ